MAQAAGESGRPRDTDARRPGAVVRGLQLGGLWALAFVQPLFGLLGDNPAFFVARDNTPGDILLFAFGFALGPVLVLVALEAVLQRANATLAWRVHLLLLALLAGVFLGQIFKSLSPSAWVMLPLALALGLLAMDAYRRLPVVRTLSSFLAVAPVVVLAVLLVLSPVSDLVFERGEATTKAGATSRTPVVLMIFDEFPTITLMKRDKSIDAQRFPHFAELARHSTWYRNTTSVADGTYVAVPAILTGQRPQAELPTSRSHPDNLFTLLGTNYAQFDQEPITSVCPANLCRKQPRQRQKRRLLDLATDLKVVEGRLLLPDRLADTLPPIDRDWEDFAADDDGDDLSAESGSTSTRRGGRPNEAGTIGRIAGGDVPSQRVRAARLVVQKIRPRRKPALYMVHNVIPHVPWRFLPNGAQYPVDGPSIPGLDDQRWKATPFQLDQAYQRDVLMSQFADNLLGEAIQRLKAQGLWDKALVIVTADHGGAIGESEERRPVTKENFGSIAGVPLFVKRPQQRNGGVSDAFTTTMDVVPTVAKVLGIDTDFPFDGRPVDEARTPRLLQQRNGRDATLIGVTPQEFVRNRDARLARQDDRFGPGEDAIWRIGPRPDLLGRPLAGLQPQTTDGRSASIDNAALFRDVDPDSGVLPVYVTGQLRGVAADAPVAVAVDGVVRATGQTYDAEGQRRFSMLVPPRTLNRGANRIDVVALDGNRATRLGSTG